MRIAIVHDWLTQFGGAEQVLAELLNLFPTADLFSLIDFLPQSQRGLLRGKKVQTSFLQSVPFARKKYRQLLPLMPLAIEQFELSSYDVVLSNHYAVAKNVIVHPDQLHLCYCQSPLRFAWDLQAQALSQMSAWKRPIARLCFHRFRPWDVTRSAGVDHFAANSHFTARRIRKCYRRSSRVIYPPVDLSRFPLQLEKESFYLTASRLVPYKRMDLVVDAFGDLRDRTLLVVGEGPERKALEKNAPSNVRFLGYVNEKTLANLMGRAKAFVFAATEDFGIVPLEAQSSGTPVIAYGKGGALETIQNATGEFFYQTDKQALIEAIASFERRVIDPRLCRANAERFSLERFRIQFSEFFHEMSNQGTLYENRDSCRRKRAETLAPIA